METILVKVKGSKLTVGSEVSGFGSTHLDEKKDYEISLRIRLEDGEVFTGQGLVKEITYEEQL